MRNIVLVIFAYALIALYELPNLAQKQAWRDLVVFSLCWLSALIISGLIVAGVKLPWIIPAIRKALTPVLIQLGLM